MRLFRPLRVQSVIQKELNKLILKEVNFPEKTLVTISRVDVSSDLANAKIGISVIPGERGDEVLEILKNKRGQLQYFLNKKMNIKPMPRIEFVRDFGLEKAADIERLLKEN